MEAERDKDNHGRASEIFSRSMASGSYLLLDAAANRLKLPLSLCQDENGQLYLPAEESRQDSVCSAAFQPRCSPEPIRMLFLNPTKSVCCRFPTTAKRLHSQSSCFPNIRAPRSCPGSTWRTLLQMTESNQKAVRNVASNISAAKGDLLAPEGGVTGSQRSCQSN